MRLLACLSNACVLTHIRIHVYHSTRNSFCVFTCAFSLQSRTADAARAMVADRYEGADMRVSVCLVLMLVCVRVCMRVSVSVISVCVLRLHEGACAYLCVCIEFAHLNVCAAVMDGLVVHMPHVCVLKPLQTFPPPQTCMHKNKHTRTQHTYNTHT